MAIVSITPVIVAQSLTQVTMPVVGSNCGNFTGIEVAPEGNDMVVS
jgi:hypothetical protein